MLSLHRKTLRQSPTENKPYNVHSLGDRIRALEDDIHRLQLLAIAVSVHGCEFSAAELLDQAQHDPDLRFVLRHARTPKQVGRRLAQLAALPNTGVRLVRIPRNEDGCIWVIEIQDDASVSRGGGV